MAGKRPKQEKAHHDKAVKIAEAVESAPANQISSEKYFILCNGTAIKTLEELALMLDKISDTEFKYHVNEQKNDFANWIRDVFAKPELAEQISSMKDRRESQIYLLKHIVSSR